MIELATMMIDRRRYGGYLTPFVGEIERLWQQGKTAREIADILGREVDKRTGYWPLTENIRYVLGRIGYYENLRSIAVTPVVPPRRYWIDWRAMFRRPYILTPGRPIDMGGPRDVWIERDPWSDV